MCRPIAAPETVPDCPSALPTRRNSRRRRIPAIALRRVDAAACYGVSPATFDRMNAGGVIPAPVKLAGVLIWNRHELQAHLDHGGPPRREWAPLWREIVRHRRARS